MVRLLYISGMVFFTVLIGDSAHRLHRQYQNGTLFEAYGSESRSAVTLLAVSSCGLAAVCIAELYRLRRRRPHHGAPFLWNEEKPAEEKSGSTNIYATPVKVDEWQEKTPRLILTRSTRSAKKLLSLEMTGLWIALLRIYAGVLPVVYTYVLLNYLFYWLPSGAGNPILSILFPALFAGSVITSAGILRRKSWGMKLGFPIAIFHLLIFPLGTAAGFVMLIALLGAANDFDMVSHKRRLIRKAKRRRAKRRRIPSTAL